MKVTGVNYLPIHRSAHPYHLKSVFALKRQPVTQKASSATIIACVVTHFLMVLTIILIIQVVYLRDPAQDGLKHQIGCE